MTIAWMIFGVLISLVVVCGAEAAASALRLVSTPTRWVWGAAIAVMFALVAGAPYREARTAFVTANLRATQVVAAPAVAPSTPTVASVLARISANATASLRDVVRTGARVIPPRIGVYAAVAWGIASAVLMLLLGAVYLRMRLARRNWPAIALQGTAVRVSEQAGPAIVGVLHPEIVVPRWLLARTTNEQRMALTHEREHLHARDHLLLGAGCLAVVLMPWNPCVWWMFSRLRLAIELDCDARVLKQGTEPRSYGSLLIDLAEQSVGLRMGAPALVDGSSHLQTRVMAMKQETHRFARVRGSIVGLAALSLVLVACEAKLPTSDEIQQMDVASAEKATAMAMEGSANVRYLIDGAGATPEQAHALRPDQIVAIDVAQSAKSDAAKVIDIRTVNGPQRTRLESDSTKVGDAPLKAAAAALTNIGTAPAVDGANRKVRIIPDTAAFKGLLVIDGAFVDPSTMKKMDPKDIASIDVLKGPAAMAMYNDPRAANGVIDIKMKKAP